MSLPKTQSYVGIEESGETTIQDGTTRSSGCGAGLGVRIRRMEDDDVGRVRELRSVVRWPTDPSSFDLLRGIRDARWSVAEARDGTLAGMVGAVPLGEVGILCHLAVHECYRGRGVGAGLTLWAVAYLRSRGARVIRLYTTLAGRRTLPLGGLRARGAPRRLPSGGRGERPAGVREKVPCRKSRSRRPVGSLSGWIIGLAGRIGRP